MKLLYFSLLNSPFNIPTFDNYQKKARGSEAKVGLSHIYTGERAFHAEYGSYCANLDSIGANHTDENYYTGFLLVTAPVSGSCGALTAGGKESVSVPNTAGTVPTFAAACAVDNTNAEFQACAYSGNTNLTGQNWKIDQAKDLDTL